MTREGLKQDMLLAMSKVHSGNAAEAQRIVDAILEAIEAAGVTLVPVLPTEDQFRAGATFRFAVETHGFKDTAGIYEAMLAASPYAPAQKDTGHE